MLQQSKKGRDETIRNRSCREERIMKELKQDRMAQTKRPVSRETGKIKKPQCALGLRTLQLDSALFLQST